MDASAFKVAGILRRLQSARFRKPCGGGLKKRGIKKLKVVYSEEEAMKPLETEDMSCRSHCVCPPGTQRKCTARRQIPGSNAFVPSVVGLIMAGEVVKDLTADTGKRKNADEIKKEK